jgi:hypothetical protein
MTTISLRCRKLLMQVWRVHRRGSFRPSHAARWHGARTSLAEDVQGLPDGTVVQQWVQDDTLPTGPYRKERRWVAPFRARQLRG